MDELVSEGVWRFNANVLDVVKEKSYRPSDFCSHYFIYMQVS